MVRKTKLEMSTDHRMGVFLMLWESQIDGRPARGAVRWLAIQFNIDVSTTNRLWRGTKNKINACLNVVQNGAPIDNHAIHALINNVNFYESGRKLSGLKPKWDVKELQDVVRGMPLTDRQTFPQLARNLLVPRSTVQRLFKCGHFRRHTSALKPFLTEENKISRVAYALEEIDGATLGAAAADGVVRFKDMFDRVDVDEKWFYQTSDGKNCILTAAEHDQMEGDHEKEPHRTISHKNHNTKVMFLCAQARPRWDPHKHTILGWQDWYLANWTFCSCTKNKHQQACRDTSVAR
jgi:hypothetical protein